MVQLNPQRADAGDPAEPHSESPVRPVAEQARHHQAEVLPQRAAGHAPRQDGAVLRRPAEDKIVVLSVISAQRAEGCAPLMARLAEVQRLLLGWFAEDVHFYSITTTPNRTPRDAARVRRRARRARQVVAAHRVPDGRRVPARRARMDRGPRGRRRGAAGGVRPLRQRDAPRRGARATRRPRRSASPRTWRS
jgi:hypothetical protein